MKIIIKDKRYGCFSANVICDCGKNVYSKNFSWDEDKIGIGEKEKIYDVICCDMADKEILFCCKCGKRIRGKENV